MKKEEILVMGVRIPKSLHKKFKLKATKQGTGMSSILRAFIQIYVQQNGGKKDGKTKR